MNTDDLIRESLRKQADLAPPPYAVLAALHKPRRSRKPLVVAVAVMASVLAAVVLAVHRVPPEPPEPAKSPPARYQPGWLPAGLTEQFRSVSGSDYQRVWKNGVQEVGLTVRLKKAHLVVPSGVSLLPRGPGRSALLISFDPGGGAALTWVEGEDQLQVFARGVTDESEVARQVAESVTSDGGGRPGEVIVPPRRIVEGSDRVEQRWTGTSPTDWAIESATVRQGRCTVLRLTSAAPDTTGGVLVRARGVDATYVPPRPQDGGMTDPLLVVPVKDAFLTIGGKPSGDPDAAAAEMSVEELVTIADAATVQDPYVSWLGTR